MSANSLYTPQRQSPKGLIILFFYGLIQIIKPLWTVIFILVLRHRNDFNLNYILVIIASTLLLALIIGYLNYRFFTFYIDKDHQQFILEKGWLNRTKTVIKFDKIQQVNLQQKFIHQIIHLYEVHIDTAGSSGNEVKIPAVDKMVAQMIQEELSKEYLKEDSNKEQGIKSQNFHNNAEKSISISLKQLIYIGITKNYIQSVVVLLVFAVQILEQFSNFFANQDETYQDLNTKYSTFIEEFLHSLQNFVVIFLILFLIFLAITINLIRTLIQYFQYKIVLKRNRFLASYGLFDKRQTTIHNKRIQWLNIQQNYFQKKLNISEIKANQAGGVTEKDQKSIHNISVPGISISDQEILVKHIYSIPISYHKIIRPKKIKFFIRALWFSIIPAILITSYLYINSHILYIPFVIICAAFILFFQYRIYKNACLWWGKDYIVIKKGFWDIDIQILPISKIQKIRRYRYIWQVKRKIAHLSLETASSDITFSYSNVSEIDELTNYCLYDIESRNSHWM